MPISRSKTILVPPILGLVVTAMGCQSATNEYEAPPPPQVTVAVALRQPLTPFLEERGVIEAEEEAEVRSRVQGFVESVKFQPGSWVSAGDLLYEIERDQYEAKFNSAEAEVESAEAAVGAAEATVATAEAEVKVTAQNLSREKRLLDGNAGSQSDYDEAVAANESAIANLDSTKANVDVAKAQLGQTIARRAQVKLDLDYTTVESPIDGRISITDIKKGNLVENGTQLAAVVDRRTVFVNFSISDRQMLRFLKERLDETKPGESLEETDLAEIPVYLGREIDNGFPFLGKLNYVDQQGVDADTGTLGMRAKFDNPDDQLFPGLFVSIRMPTAVPSEAMLIPERAILRDQVGQFVLTVDAERKVQRTAVVVDRIVSGWGVITGGVDSETLVVVAGLQRARPGLEVVASEIKLQVDDEALLRGLALTGNIGDLSADQEPKEDPANVESQP